MPTKAKREKKPLHWISQDLFKLAKEKGLNDQGFEDAIKEQTGNRIPSNTLKWWRLGGSHPQITEVEWMADALGYELDLILKEKE